MPLKIDLSWQQTANYREVIELDDDQVAEMEASGVNPYNRQDVFQYLNDRDELIKYEPVSYDGAEMDEWT